jgi:hypothetical protein
LLCYQLLDSVVGAFEAQAREPALYLLATRMEVAHAHPNKSVLWGHAELRHQGGVHHLLVPRWVCLFEVLELRKGALMRHSVCSACSVYCLSTRKHVLLLRSCRENAWWPAYVLGYGRVARQGLELASRHFSLNRRSQRPGRGYGAARRGLRELQAAG